LECKNEREEVCSAEGGERVKGKSPLHAIPNIDTLIKSWPLDQSKKTCGLNPSHPLQSWSPSTSHEYLDIFMTSVSSLAQFPRSRLNEPYLTYR
jgi:hypothetical protein